MAAFVSDHLMGADFSPRPSTVAGSLIDSDAATSRPWPEAVSDGLTLACPDCGQVPRFDYRVTPEFWSRWVPGPERLGVVCLPCLDVRCGGAGLADALLEVQWTGTGHTVVLRPTLRHEYEPT